MIQAAASPLAFGTSLGTLLVILVAWTTTFVSYLVYLNYMVSESMTNPFVAATSLVMFLIGTFLARYMPPVRHGSCFIYGN